MGEIINPSQREDLVDKTPQGAYAILKEEDVELTDKQLELVAGGGDWTDIGKDVGYVNCPKCGQVNLVVRPKTKITCTKCGHTFTAEWPS